MNVLSPLCTILCHLWLQIQLLHVIFNTFKPCLSWPSSATFSFHLNISAGTYPLLSYHMLHVSKPTQSTSPGGGIDPEPIRCRVDSPLHSSRESRQLLLPRFKQLRNPARGILQIQGCECKVVLD